MESTERNRRIGQKIKELRETRGWSQNELARKMTARVELGNFYPMTIKRIESGERPIKLDEAIELAHLLGIPLGALVAITDNELYYQRELENMGEMLESYEFQKKALSEAIPLYIDAYLGLSSYASQAVSTRFPADRRVIKATALAQNPYHFWEILRNACQTDLADSLVYNTKPVTPKQGEEWVTKILGIQPATNLREEITEGES